MRSFKSRVEDATFELNLAPMLDIIVSIIPMLLLSVAFVQVTVIDTPVPQAVERAIASNEKKEDSVQIQLHVSKQDGFRYTVISNGQTNERVVAVKDAKLDLDGLHKETLALKATHPGVFRLELNPDESVQLEEIVAVMDQIRTTASGEPKITFTDTETGKPVETNLLFPDIVFGNVAGG